MKKLFLIVSMMLLVIVQSFSAGPKVPYTNQGFYTNAQIQLPVNFVSVQDIKNSLKGQPPITVSFDIDDTLLFSSPYFYYAFTSGYFGNNPREVLSSQKFWDWIAEQGDLLSIPKKVAKDLIKMHLERGDKIVFITGRTPHSNFKKGTMDKLAYTLKKDFNLPYDVPINYTSETPINGYKYDKTAYIKDNNVKIHYGDSDSDILAAREAGIRGIRIQRAYNSTNPQNMNGGYGEEVVINSAF